MDLKKYTKRVYAKKIRDKNKIRETTFKNGERCYIEVMIAPLYDDLDNFLEEIVIYNDVTEKKNLEKLIITDPLTELYNRRFFNEIIEKEIEKAKRNKTTLSFMMIDIDFFKKYNDTYGHNAGDEALKLVANSFKNSLKRKSDLIFRLGGEEFGILFQTKTKEDAQSLAESVREGVKKLNIEHKNSSANEVMTISAGLLFIDFSQEDVDKDGLYTMADEALYIAKKERNRVVIYENNEIEFFG